MSPTDEDPVEVRAHELMLVALTESGRRAEDLQELLPEIWGQVLSLGPEGAGHAAELLCEIWRGVIGFGVPFMPLVDNEKWMQAAEAASLLSAGAADRAVPLLKADEEVATYTLSLMIEALAPRMRAAIEWGARGGVATGDFRSPNPR